jgi:hypothetical protein
MAEQHYPDFDTSLGRRDTGGEYSARGERAGAPSRPSSAAGTQRRNAGSLPLALPHAPAVNGVVPEDKYLTLEARGGPRAAGIAFVRLRPNAEARACAAALRRRSTFG